MISRNLGLVPVVVGARTGDQGFLHSYSGISLLTRDLLDSQQVLHLLLQLPLEGDRASGSKRNPSYIGFIACPGLDLDPILAWLYAGKLQGRDAEELVFQVDPGILLDGPDLQAGCGLGACDPGKLQLLFSRQGTEPLPFYKAMHFDLIHYYHSYHFISHPS